MGTKDMMTTLSLIQEFWPDFPIVKEDLLSPTTDFIVRFYTNFLAEFNDKVAYVANEEIPKEELDFGCEFGREVALYKKLSKIFKKLKYFSFNLMDIYCPQPKRIYNSIKFSIHFLIYINNCLDDIIDNCNSIYKKVTEWGNLNSLKQQILQDCGDNAERLAHLEDEVEELKKKNDAVEAGHKKLHQDKVISEKTYVEKRSEMKKLQNENDNLDYEFKDLETKESELRKRLVTEEDFESLKKTTKYLEQEFEQVCKEDLTIGNDSKQIEMIKYIKKYVEDLKNLDFKSLNVEALNSCEEEAKSVKKVHNEFVSELMSLKTERDNKLDILNKKQQMKVAAHKQCVEIQCKINSEVESFKKLYEEKCVQVRAKSGESQTLQNKTVCVLKEIKKIDDLEKVLGQAAIENYKKILDSSTASTQKMNDALLTMKKKTVIIAKMLH